MDPAEQLSMQHMIASPSRCCVVTVTYGERFALLRRVLERVLSLGVGEVIVVDNGSGEKTRAALAEAEAREGRLSVLRLPENLGSAGGYGAGIQRAVAEGACEYLWLLDDDNVPDPDALDELAHVYRELRREWGSEGLALLSLRPERDHQRLAARARDPAKVFPRRSSFMGFDVRDVPRKLKKVLGFGDPLEHLPAASGRRRSIAIPFGPYGGLFFHRSVIERIGIPDPRLYLYGDDHEFTRRFWTQGGALFLVPDSVLRDVEPAWWQKNPAQNSFGKLILASSEGRVYYSVRNQVFFERSGWMARRWLYALNRWIFFLILLVTAVRYGRLERFRLVRRAARDGADGRLGRVRLGSSSAGP